jgi:hypothetical protein
MNDPPEVLEVKWSAWVEAESFKRLAYHVFIHCVQVSVAFQTPPLISYSEMTLELPAPQAMWRAASAAEWREQYFIHEMSSQHIPSFVSSMCDVQTMGNVRGRIDLELSLYLVLLSHWLLAWEYTQLSSANKAQAMVDVQWAGTLLASSKIQELRNLFDSFQTAIDSWQVFVPKECHMTAQLLRMHISVTFEDLQLLAGKEGEDEARRVLPVLKEWYRSSDCCQAMWHAGQVLRAARRPPGRSPNASRAATPDTPWLRDFHAVALFHAGLAFWVYGLLTKAIRSDQQCMGYQHIANPIDTDGDLYFLDNEEDEPAPSMERHRFIAMNQGRPVISSISPYDHGPEVNGIGAVADGPQRYTGVRKEGSVVPIEESKKIMEVMVDALATVSEPPESHKQPTNPMSTWKGPQRPAMVENLIQLLRDLGEAASAV